MRPSWDGYLRLNLLSIPVKAFSVSVSGGGRIGFHQIHAGCNSRIQYKKWCPIHGEVTKDEIVPGYEVAKNQYVIFEQDQLSALRVSNAEKTIAIDVFIRPEALDPIYYGERSYYLTPDGKIGQRPYAVLHQVMAEENRFGLASMILSGREQLVLVRPMDKLLTITVLNYDAQIKRPETFEQELEDVPVKPAEIKLAKTLLESSSIDDLDFAQYRDEYTNKVQKLIESKSKGIKSLGTDTVDEPAVINLMDALKQSLRVAKSSSRTKPASRPSGSSRRTAAHRRKIG